MDQSCSRAELQTCLKDLAWVNRVLFGYRPTLNWLKTLNLQCPGRRPGAESLGQPEPCGDTSGPAPLRILDVGCGYGDTLRQIEQWAWRQGINVELAGLDLNPDATAIAGEATPPTSRIQWLTGDVFAYTPHQPPHLIVTSLFTHHLPDDDLVRFLKWLETNAVKGWFINDLSRNITPYRLFRLFSRVMRLHPFVQHDGPVSIARAFVPEDWRRYCCMAGLSADEVDIRGFTPGRLCVSRNMSQ